MLGVLDSCSTPLNLSDFQISFEPCCVRMQKIMLRSLVSLLFFPALSTALQCLKCQVRYHKKVFIVSCHHLASGQH